MANLSDGTIYIQGETFEIIAGTGVEPASLSRTQSSNQEKHGLNGVGLPNRAGGADDNPGAPEYDEYGLRPGYTGDGYLDINGDAGAARLAFTFEAEPGTYEVTLRLANGSSGSAATATRPILLRTEAGETESQTTQTDHGGPAPLWYLWELRTFTVTVIGEPGVSKLHRVEIVTEAANGPNIDAVAIAEVGTPVSFVAPTIRTSALDAVENGVAAGKVLGVDGDDQALTFSITGGADADKFDIAADGTLTFRAAPDYEMPGSAVGTNAYALEITATDGAQSVAQSLTVAVTDTVELPTPVIEQIVLSGETGTITGTTTIHRQQSTADDAANPTREGDPANSTATIPLDEFGLRAGYSGEGYTDFGSTEGDKVAWTINVDTAGSYDLHIRYATSSAQSLELVAGETALLQDFPPVNGSDLKDWITVTVPVVLTSGDNTVSLAIPAGFTSGPNVDGIAVTTAGASADFFAPTFAATIGDVTIAEGTEGFMLDASATDPSETSDPVSYALSGDDANVFEIDAEGVLTFTSSPDYEAPADADGDNVYDVTIKASAGGTTVRQSVSVTVTDSGDAAPAPVLAARSVAENVAGAVVADITVADPDSVYEASDFSVADGGADMFEVVGNTVDGFVLKLMDTRSLDFEAARLSVTVMLNGVAATPFSPEVTNDVSDDAAQTAIIVKAQTFDENAAGAVVADIAVATTTYAAGDIALTGTDAGLFSIVAGASPNTFQLILTGSLDFEAGNFPSVTIGAGAATSVLTAKPADVNEAPTLAADATLADVAAVSGVESVLSLATLGAIDQDGDAVTYGVRTADGSAMPAGISVVGTDLVIAADAPQGEYALEIYATDTEFDSDSVPFAVTVAGPAAFVPFALQGETAVITLTDQRDASSTIHRDANDPAEAETPGVGKILEGGIRAGFTGLGYIDFGNDASDTATFTFDVPAAGQYDLNIRYASQDAGVAARVLDIAANGGAAAKTTFPSTGPSSGPDVQQGFNVWSFLTVPVTLDAGPNTVSLAMAVGTSAGPNVDRIEITALGTGPIPAADLTADADGDVLATADAVVNAQDLGAVEIALAGIDADIVRFEASIAGGAFATVPATGTGAAKIVTLDLSAFGDSESVSVALRLTDDVGNTVTRDVAIAVEAAPTAAAGVASTGMEAAVTIALADLIADAEDGEPSIVSATSQGGTVVIDDVLKTLTFTPNEGVSGPVAIDYILRDTAGQEIGAQIEVTVATGISPTITLVAAAFSENDAGAIVADIVVTDANPSAPEIDLGGNTAYRVIGEPGALKLALAEGSFADAEGAALAGVSVNFGTVASNEISPVATDLDDPAQITLIPLDFSESAAGAAVAAIVVTDQDAGDLYAPSDVTVSGDPLDRFEVVEQDGLKLVLKAGRSLGAEPVQPTLTVSVGGGTTAITPAPRGIVEPRAITFDGLITAYSNQDSPTHGGSVTADEGSIQLDGNFWKRVAIDPVTLTENSVLRVTIATPVPGEIVAIGFDADGDAFDADRNLFQLAGTQRFTPFVNLAGTGRDNADGTTNFEIPLSGQAGQSFSNIVVINDDDNSGDGRGVAIFSDVEIVEVGGATVNRAPRVVGGGVADQNVNEGSPVEIDLPFVDDDGDTLSFAVSATLDGELVALPLTVSEGTLAGDLGAAAPGRYTITVTAQDGNGGAQSDTFDLTVLSLNEAPVANADVAFEPFFGAVGAEIAPIDLTQFAGAFSDPEGDALEYVVTGLPAGLRVEEGSIFGTPTSAGDGTFTIAARDPGGALSAGIEIALRIDAPGVGDVISVEAEAFTGLSTAQGFFATGQAGASGNRLIRGNAGQDAAVTTQLASNGVSEGWYTVQIDVYDETDGTAPFGLSIDGTAITAPGATFDDPGIFLNPTESRGGSGQIGNLKRISFETPVFVDADSVLTLSGRGNGELLRTDRLVFTRVEAPSIAPDTPVLTGDAVVENEAGAVAGTLSATDPDGDDAAVTFSVDVDSVFEVVGNMLKLKDGQFLDFEAGASVGVVVTATDAAGRTSSATLSVAVADVNEATGALVLTPAVVAENVPGAVIGQLSASDRGGETLTFAVTDPRFAVDASGNLSLAPDVALDFEEGETVTVSVTANDGTTTTTGDVTVAVTDANDAPVLAEGAAMADLAVASGTEGRVNLAAAFAATDEDGDAVSYGARAANGSTLPAGISVVGGELVVAQDTAAGTYMVEVFATDGTADSDSVAFQVTVGEPAAFQPIILQAEAGKIELAQPSDAQRTQIRNAENPETGTVALRPDFTGTGYVDYGNDAGDTLTLTVTVATAGRYDLNVRYASSTSRPLDLAVNGTKAATPMAFASTDPDGTGILEGFDNWSFETRTIDLVAGQNMIALSIPAGAITGPNLDRIEITAPGTGPIPASDISADADAFPLELGGIVEGSVLSATQATSINFNVTGEDSDIVRIEISFDGGVTRTDVTAIVDSDGDFVFDGSNLPVGANTATIIVTDAAGNEAFDDLAFRIETPASGMAPIVIQAEDETKVTVTDVGAPNSAGPDGASTNDTREVNAVVPDGFGNFRGGAVGDAYMDFGAEAGDAISIAVNAPVAGTYSVAIRYANGSNVVRPLEVAVNGGAASNVDFGSTGAGDAGWENWTEVTIELDLQAGANTVSLAIPTAANGGFAGGPNIDQITFTPPEGDTPAPGGAQRFEDVIRVNFEAPVSGNGSFDAPSGYVTPAGWESDTGAAFGDRGNGFDYGWVDVEGDLVTATPKAQPIGSARYKNDVPAASDLQKTYMHFEYPGADASDRERAWEIEVENGTYELTLAIGDTSGKFDSDYVVNVEGQRFGKSFTPVALDGTDYGNTGAPAYNSSFDGQGFRSSLQTAIVQVTDGRLTIDSIGGSNTEIQYLDLQRVPELTPGDGRTADLDYSKFVAAVAASTEDGQVSIEIDGEGNVPLDIDPTSSLVVGVQLQAADHRGPAITSVNGVKLIETLTGISVDINVQITGGADSLTIRPLQDLKEFTSYTLAVENVLDLGNLTNSTLPQRQFQDYTTTFVTGEAPVEVAREVAFTDQVVLNGFAEGGVAFTSIEFGPDGKLYTASITGVINRWDVNPDGTLDVASNEVLDLGYFTDGNRSIIGLAFDPEDPNVIWVTDNAPVPREGKAELTPEFSGQISKITLGANGAFEGAVAETYVTGLPRSGGDHVTNSIEFRANPDAGQPGEPNYLLYLTQGSNSAAGRPDDSWGFRPERLLNAAVLEVDPRRDAPDGGFDVQTEPYDPASNPPTYRTGAAFNVDGTFTDFYNPFADEAVLRLYGEGIRNGYDLVWHSNGNLYVPTNGTARGGNTLDDPNTSINEQISNLDKQYDYLFQVKEGGYYGHPNSLLGNYVVNGGAGGPLNVYNFDNSANTPDGGNQYASGVMADANYDRDGAYSLDFNKSPNGAIEYKGNIFGSNLNGAILIAQFSVGDNVRVINVDPVTGRVTGDDVLRRPGGDIIDDYIDPLDIIENPLTGQLYLMTLDRGTGESKIVLLNPAPGGVIADVTADAGERLALTVIDSSTPNAVLFAVSGLDDDIQSIQVSFDGGAARSVTLDAQNRFTFDLTGRSGPVTGILTVRDELPNTATATTSFTLGETPEPGASIFLDATAFRILSTQTGTGATLIRRLDDPTTYESSTSTNDTSPKDGLNDGHDGTSYLDPNGGPENKAAFDVTVAEPGTYTLVFRMAANTDRSIAINLGDQSEAITVNTVGFTTWKDYPIVLRLEAGVNTIVIQQTTAAGPNIDSVTITPLDVVAPDTTADEGGDLAILLVDATDPSDAVFRVTGDDDDIASYAISFDGGATSRAVVPDANGQFAVDISTLSGVVTATLIVRDGVPNTATADTNVTLGDTSGDGTAVIDGVTYVLYEAENAALTGQKIVGDDALEDDRGAQGGAFVDFDGTTDQTTTWTVTVGEDGAYAVDILYALAIGKAARPLTLAVDGTTVDVLPFAANSNAAETDWRPQSTVLNLTAGTHTIMLTAPAANGPNVDQLRISQSPVEPVNPGDPNADIEIRSLDPAFYSNRLHFNWLDNDSASNPDRAYKASATVEISNSGTSPLEFRSATLTGPFDLADETFFDGLVLGAGEKIQVEVLFDRSEYRSGPSSVTGVFEGALTLRTNDGDTPVAVVDLAGFWQARDEGGQEPNINEVWQIFGFGNFIEGLSLIGGGENSVLNFADVYLPADETEVLSPYWRIADGVTQAKITQIAAFHGDGGATLGIHAPGNKNQNVIFSNHAADANQSILPLNADGQFATATFTNGTIPNTWIGNDVFGIEMVNLSTDPTLNPTGAGAPSASALANRYPGYTVSNGVVFDPAGNEVPDGYTVRMFQAVDKTGNVIANTYLGVMDYTGINYDYNDNMFLIEGVQAIGNGAVLAVNGLDDAAADDRLVFTNITEENGGQAFRDVATFRIDNDGIAPLRIESLGVTGAFEVTGVAAGDTVAAGGSVNVTVRFIGSDNVNDNAAVLFDGMLAIGTNAGTKNVALAGLAQLESEKGEEPTAAQIVEAFGYGTDVAQDQLANGGRIETIGDEILLPYLERLDGSKPVEIIQIAAFLNQGNVARLSAHGLDSSALTQLFAADDNQGQTVLPDGLVPGTGDTGTVARSIINSDAPFGLKVTVDGRPTYASWTDPEANRIDPNFGQLVADDAGHLIRFFQAKDAAGNVIEGTFIGIQDYPGAGNYDYNDHMFVIKNVQAHGLTAAEDANRDGILDVLRTDADGDGKVAFFDPDDSAEPGPTRGDYVVGFNVGGPAVASQIGLDGVPLRGDGDGLISYAGDGATRAPSFDLASNPNGANALAGAFKSYRDGKVWTATVNGLIDGEYVVVLHTQETYHAASGKRKFDLLIDGKLVADDLDPFAVAGGDRKVSIEAVVKVTGGSFTVTLDAMGSDGIDNAALNAITIFQSGTNPSGGLATTNSAPTTTGIAGVPAATEGQTFNFDVARFFADADPADMLTFTASLPEGLSISTSGLIAGTPVADGTYNVTVTASDGKASVSSTFALPVANSTAPAGQTPFPGPNAAGFTGDVLTVDASNYDQGGQGVAYNDDPGLGKGARNGGRTGSDVEQSSLGDIGWVKNGEWLEYTINVAADGTYDLDMLLATPNSGRSVNVDFYQPGSATPYATSGSIASTPTGSYTNFQERSADGISLQAGTQIVRVTFAGNDQDFRSFSLTRQAEPNTAPTSAGIANATANEGTAFTLDAGAAFTDVDADALSYTATGLPSGLSISAAGVISGTLPQVASSRDFAVTVTANDGRASTAETFTILVADVPAPTGQTPFPGPNAAGFTGDVLTVDASNYDQGGQGVAYNDDPGLGKGARNGGRTGSDVEQSSLGDIGWVKNGEWLEYTINVAADGTYDLDMLLATPNSGRSVNVDFYQPGSATPYATSGSIASTPTGSYTNFQERSADGISLQAGTQIVRVTFAGNDQDFRSFSLTRVESLPSAEQQVQFSAQGDTIDQISRISLAQSDSDQPSIMAYDQSFDGPEADGINSSDIALGLGSTFDPVDAFVFLSDMPAELGSDPTDLRVTGMATSGASVHPEDERFKEGGIAPVGETSGLAAIENGLISGDYLYL